MRLILMCAVLAALALAGTTESQDKPGVIDAKKLIGQWKPSAKNKGKVLLDMVVEFKTGEKLNVTFNIKDKVTEVAGTYKIDGNKLTMKFKAGDQEKVEVSTILKLTDDELTTRDEKGKEEFFARVKAQKDDAQDKPAQIDAKKLVGKWKATDKEGKAANSFAEFKADGKVTLTGDFKGKTYDVPGTYKLDGNKLLMKMKIGDEETDEEVTILKLTDTELATTEKNGKKSNFERVKAKMDEPVQVDAKKLVGKWKGTDEKTKAANTVAEFMADGKMSVTADFNGKTFVVPGTYKIDGNKLLMKTKIRDLEMDDEATILQLTDDILVTESKNGKKLNFERVKAKNGGK